MQGLKLHWQNLVSSDSSFQFNGEKPARTANIIPECQFSSNPAVGDQVQSVSFQVVFSHDVQTGLNNANEDLNRARLQKWDIFTRNHFVVVSQSHQKEKDARCQPAVHGTFEPLFILFNRSFEFKQCQQDDQKEDSQDCPIKWSNKTKRKDKEK